MKESRPTHQLLKSHGDLLGAHGSLHQKWYCAYEEMLHVPFLIHNRRLFPQNRDIRGLTSHLDLLPTMLGLANADMDAIHEQLQGKFSELRPLAGRNLAPVILHGTELADEPIYYMSDDDVTRGQHQINPLGRPYPSVAQPNHVETVIATLHNGARKELWKLSRYFDNVQFWSQPGIQDEWYTPVYGEADGTETQWSLQVKTKPEPDEYELYNLSDDPLETHNLACHSLATPYTRSIQARMMQLLEGQRKHKRLYPASSQLAP
ncbi:sulfatase-like hydrolase/transferase [Paenibacillus sp. GCM10027626]|uniref:sulfatase-like hydrolase/transferase n=1 Tax=Paenibacillus sp. GCM10027626 TaxID=3273411 RepID=UPI00363A530A